MSAGSFFQVNRFLVDDLVSLVTSGVSGKLALDLYAGVGLFSTVLARSFAQVIAVEASQTSYSDLRQNAVPEVKAVRATTEQYLGQATALRPDGWWGPFVYLQQDRNWMWWRDLLHNPPKP